ncbi:MAG: hypothetical protein O3A63_20860, partial [Proteobacteria bacterium]|nr:hypothetical protein [Pseudomonadota bacterium]
MSSWALGGPEGVDEQDPTASATRKALAKDRKPEIHCPFFFIARRIAESSRFREQRIFVQSNSANANEISITEIRLD